MFQNRSAAHASNQPIHVDELHNEGWPSLERCLTEHAAGLSLPDGLSSALELVPAELRHKLRVQSCFSAIYDLTEDPAQITVYEDGQDCVDWFIDQLRDYRDSVGYLGITLASLRSRLALPAASEELLIQMMKQKLQAQSEDEPIADLLL